MELESTVDSDVSSKEKKNASRARCSVSDLFTTGTATQEST